MSAAELIEQIKALPPEELELVRSFLVNGDTAAEKEVDVKYLDREKARSLGATVMEENDELFRKLAQ